MKSEEKHRTKTANGEPTSCCGREMEQRMRTFFASLGSEDEEESGSCADWISEMMQKCCRSFSNEEPTKG